MKKWCRPSRLVYKSPKWKRSSSSLWNRSGLTMRSHLCFFGKLHNWGTSCLIQRSNSELPLYICDILRHATCLSTFENITHSRWFGTQVGPPETACLVLLKMLRKVHRTKMNPHATWAGSFICFCVVCCSFTKCILLHAAFREKGSCSQTVCDPSVDTKGIAHMQIARKTSEQPGIRCHKAQLFADVWRLPVIDLAYLTCHVLALKA